MRHSSFPVVAALFALGGCTPAQVVSPGTQTVALPISSTSALGWQNFPMPSLSQPFTLEFDAVPNAGNVNALTTLGNGLASASNSGAVVLRFNGGGSIDAENGASFSSVEAIPYAAGTSYHFRVSVDVAAQVFDAIVTPDGDVDHILAARFAFATAAASPASLNDLGIEASSGSHTLSNVRLTIPIQTGSAPPSDSGVVVPDAGATLPQAASNLTGQSASSSSIQLQWQDNANDETGFIIQRRATHGSPTFVQVGQVGANTTQFLDNGLNASWQYDYLVIAFNGAGDAPPSNMITVQVTGSTADAGSGGGGSDAGMTAGRQVNCNNNSGDAALIQSALNQGGAVSLYGTCQLGSTQLTFGSNLTINGSATLNYSGSAYAMASSGNNNTVTGLTFVGGGLELSLNDRTNWTAQSGWAITHNTFKNISNGNDGVHIDNILGKGAASTISNNTFSNVWGVSGQGYPAFPSNCASTDTCANGSGIWWEMGLDNTTIDSNTFDMIGFNAIKGFWDGFVGKTAPYTGHNIVFSNNIMSRVHRIGMEMQTAGQGNCPGGCNYSDIPSDGTVVKGNYYHDPVFQMDNFAFSIMASSTNAQIINNTGVDENPTCIWPLGIGLENTMWGGVMQGNVIGSAYQSCAGNYNDNHGWAVTMCPGYTNAAYTNRFQNNVSCGDNQAGQHVAHCDPGDNATNVETADYWANSCPAGANPAVSNISIAFTSPNNQTFTGGGNGTWNVAVVSNLSIRDLQFFVDGAATPVVTQELQDLNSGFASDLEWLYHATFDTSSLASGAHTIVAVATDVSRATQSASQSFSR